ncbi:MAG: hypothetical protein JNL83_12035 [Myxococcales bacterium]|nr:hypothetical protein [Myxococcales bacterium]
MRALAILALLAPVATAHADDTFEARAAAAKPLRHLDDLVWAFTATCDQGDDTQNRQCKALRDRRLAELAGATLLVEADADALDIGAWSPAKRSVSVTLTGCVRCKGVTVEGKRYVLTAGKTLYDTARQFQTAEVAAAWIKAVAHHRVELLVKVPARPRSTQNGVETITLDVQGYRVTTPCNGTVVIANPPAQNAPPDKAACAAGGAAVVALTQDHVAEAMQAPMSVIKVCAKKEKAKGTGKLELTIADDGTLAAYEQTGDFVGTPMGACIDSAMKGVTFPRSAKPRTRIGYPIALP